MFMLFQKFCHFISLYLVQIQGMSQGRYRITIFAFFGKLLFLPGHQKSSQIWPVTEDCLIRTDKPWGQFIHVHLGQGLVQPLFQWFSLRKNWFSIQILRNGVLWKSYDETSVTFGEIDTFLSEQLFHFQQSGARRRSCDLEVSGI